MYVVSWNSYPDPGPGILPAGATFGHDESVKLLEAKRDLADRIKRSGEKALTELSAEEIIDLISYRKKRF